MKIGKFLIIFIAIAIIGSFGFGIINYDNRVVYDLFMYFGILLTIIEGGLLYISK